MRCSDMGPLSPARTEPMQPPQDVLQTKDLCLVLPTCLTSGCMRGVRVQLMWRGGRQSDLPALHKCHRLEVIRRTALSVVWSFTLKGTGGDNWGQQCPNKVPDSSENDTEGALCSFSVHLK